MLVIQMEGLLKQGQVNQADVDGVTLTLPDISVFCFLIMGMGGPKQGQVNHGVTLPEVSVF